MGRAVGLPVPLRWSSTMYVTTKEAARLLGFHPITLAKWRVSGDGPPYRKVGRSIRYDPAVIEEWMAERSYENTTQYGRPS
jgi:predicted DNA-binding transcriptional regulator AlpA